MHDNDAALILDKVLSLLKVAGGLRYSPRARAAGWLFWQGLAPDRKNLIERRAQSAGRLRERLKDGRAEEELSRELTHGVAEALKALGLEREAGVARFAARYLVSEISQERAKFTESAAAAELKRIWKRRARRAGSKKTCACCRRIRPSGCASRCRTWMRLRAAPARARSIGWSWRRARCAMGTWSFRCRAPAWW